MSSDDTTFPFPSGPTSTLKELERDCIAENAVNLAREHEESNHDPKANQDPHLLQVASSLPSYLQTQSTTYILSHTWDLDRSIGEESSPTNSQRTNASWCDHEQTIFTQQKNSPTGFASASQPKSFQMAAQISTSASFGTTQQEQLNASRNDFLVPTPTAYETEANNSTLPFAPWCPTTFQPAGPVQALESVSDTVGPQVSTPSRLHPALVQAPLGPRDSITDSGQSKTISRDTFGDINWESVQVSTEVEACQWLENFKHFVSCQKTADKAGQKISGWLGRQRRLHVRNKLHPKRRSLLAQFDVLDTWKLKPFKETEAQKAKWMLQFEKLKQYHLEEGNFNVPMKHDKTLYSWRKRQQAKHRDWTEGVFDMPLYRIEKLNEIGFEW